MLATLLTMLAAQAFPNAPSPAAGEVQRVGRQQIFIAPSGEPFRAPADAPYPVGDWFARADANHDGRLTESEFIIDFLRFFTSLDLNHDGIIDSSELDRYETEMAAELHTGSFAGDWHAASEDSGDGGEVGQNHRRLGSYMGADNPQGGGRFDLLRIPEPVAAMDVELNGRISRREAQDAAEYRFSLLDSQHHGFLLLADLPQTFAQAHHNAAGGHGRSGGKREGHRRYGGESASGN